MTEIKEGLADASLGNHIVKNRTGIRGRGKRGGARTILAYREGKRMFFIYGFTKSERSNINSQKLAALKKPANNLLTYNRDEINALYCAA